MQHSLKDGSAKDTIKGLSHSGDHYVEAIECLKSRYNRRRLIHQTHVRKILDTPRIGKHLRALKAMDYDLSSPFITLLLELKLD